MKSLTTLAISLTIIASASGSALANEILGAYFGNTLTVTRQDRSTVSWYYNEDGTFSNTDGDSGTWELKGDNTCITPAGKDEMCFESDAGRKVGDTWNYVGADGEEVTITVTAGR